MHILSSGERVHQMRGSFTASWCPHVMADRVVNRTEGVFGDGGLGLDSVDLMVSKKKKPLRYSRDNPPGLEPEVKEWSAL